MKHTHGGQILKMERYAACSRLASLNSMLKMVTGVASLCICVLSSGSLTPMAVGAVMVFATVFLGNMEGRAYLHLMLLPFSFIMLSTIAILVDITRQGLGFIDIPIGSFYLSITKESLMETQRVILKALGALTCLYMISLSTPLHEIIGVLKRCRVPALMIELMYFIYRFLFILMDVYRQMKTAANSRLGYQNLKRSYRTFFGICTNLLVLAFYRARRTFDAMESRCYDGNVRFMEEEKPVAGWQGVAAGIYLTAAAGMMLAERIWW